MEELFCPGFSERDCRKYTFHRENKGVGVIRNEIKRTLRERKELSLPEKSGPDKEWEETNKLLQ